MAFVKVAEVGEDARNAFTNAFDHLAPPAQIFILLTLRYVEARQVARAHPANVDKICGRMLGQMPDLFRRDPLTFDERQRNIVLAQKIYHRLLYPIRAAKLQAEAYVARQAWHKRAQGAPVLRYQLKLRRHLNQHAGELLFECARALAELFDEEDASRSERAFVCDLARQFHT